MVRHRKCMFYFGPNIWILYQKYFLYRTPIFVSGAFVALDVGVASNSPSALILRGLDKSPVLISLELNFYSRVSFFFHFGFEGWHIMLL